MKKFKLKSGNTTPFKQMGSSPTKQAIGGGAGEAVDHWKKYKVDKAVDKLLTNKNISKVDFERKLAKITKTVNPYPKSKSTILKRTSKAFKNTVKQYAKRAIKGIGGKASTTIGMYIGSMGTAKATQPGTGGHGGTKTQFLRDIDKK